MLKLWAANDTIMPKKRDQPAVGNDPRSAKPPYSIARWVAAVLGVSSTAATIYGFYADKRVAVLAFIGMVFAIVLLLVVALAAREILKTGTRSAFWDILVKVLVAFILVYFMVATSYLFPSVMEWLKSGFAAERTKPVPDTEELFSEIEMGQGSIIIMASDQVPSSESDKTVDAFSNKCRTYRVLAGTGISDEIKARLQIAEAIIEFGKRNASVARKLVPHQQEPPKFLIKTALGPDTNVDWAIHLASEGRRVESITFLENAASNGNNYTRSRACYYLGCADFGREHFEDARKHFTEGIGWENSNGSNFMGLSRCFKESADELVRNGDANAARMLYVQAIDNAIGAVFRDPHNPQIRAEAALIAGLSYYNGLHEWRPAYPLFLFLRESSDLSDQKIAQSNLDEINRKHAK